jgi:hypothetical protein
VAGVATIQGSDTIKVREGESGSATFYAEDKNGMRLIGEIEF